ncbi:uncharacterized protein [Dermacentor albipictus]|uniref:uncharacterized protein isoform X2 n=1 Tax=Dermacentor albipictus TaxID=60249 RepID=UPI0038FD13C9
MTGSGCTNRAGTVTRFAVAVVEEPVSGLRLTVRRPASFPLVPLGETVELEAELISGTGLTFRWRIADERSINEPATVETRGRTSVARHRFSVPGTYNVSVSASNGLLSRNGAHRAAHVGRPLRVVEAIDGLAADVMGGRYAVLLPPCRKSGDSENEGTPSLPTTPSSTGITGRRGTGEPCLRDCGHPSETIRSRPGGHTHAVHLEEESAARYLHRSVTLPSAISRNERTSRNLEASLPGAEEEVQGDRSTAITSAPRVLLPERAPRQVNRGTARKRHDVHRLSPTVQEGLSVRSPDDEVLPRLWREQKRQSSSPPPPQHQKQPRDCRSSGVQFGAHVARGSDVVFVFHFGDGSSQRVEPATRQGIGSMAHTAASAVVTHHYKRGGRFSVSVTASNPLGSVTRLIDRPVYVGSPAEGLTLEPSEYAVVAAGRSGSFRAALRRGANATVAWELRSASEPAEAPARRLRARNTGTTFERVFESPGTYHLMAEASNPVTEGLQLPRPRAQVKVLVQELLREASLCVGPPAAAETCAPADVTLPLEKRLLLRASVVPATEKTLRFLWSLMPQRERYVTDAAAVNLRPTGPGTYVVRVTCQNHVSSVSSPELALRLVERVTNLNGINVLGPVLVARPTRLRAVYATGSNLTFSWNFGDGSDPVSVTAGPEVSHTFTRVREYWIKVVAYNAFSRAEFETNVFATQQPCSKPELRLHRYTEVRFNETVYVEAAVGTSCPISAKIRYSWTVLNATGSHVVLEHSGGALSRKDLLLPAGTLPVGRYLLSLKVRMMPTAVYAVANATLAVVPPPVSFSIAGGSWRTVGPSAIVILEAEVYPPDLSDYIITWKCEVLNDAHADCFTHPVPSLLAKRSTRTLRFLASSLDSKSAFLFTAMLTLGNASSHIAQQVLNASETGPRSRLIDVSCQSCDYERHVRSHEKVALTASCQECDPSEELDFEWSVWSLSDHKSLHHGDDHCYGSIGSTQMRLGNSRAHVGRTPHRRAYDIQHTLHQAGSRIPPFPPFPDFANGTGSAKNVHFEPTENHRFTRLGKQQRSNVPKGPRRIDSRLGVVSADSRSASVLRKIFGYSRKRVEVSSFVSSFRHSSWLVLQPGALIAKCSYAVHVKVRRKGSNDTVGEARERIIVGGGTSGGQCNIQPPTGVALETLFTVNCSIWKGGRKPYVYVISYGLSPAGPWRQLYRGSHSTASFWLPPGMASQNNSVHIRMVIQDADGFRLCLPQTNVLRVLNSMELFVMKNETSHLSPRITRLFDDQQYQAALNKLQVLIAALRSIEAPKSTLPTYQLDLFRSVWRFAICVLRDLESLPVNTVQAFIQTWNIIVEPRFPGEEHDLIAASQLLQFFVQDVQTSQLAMSGQFEAVVQELVTALGHLIKSAQTLSLHTWHMFYECIHNIEDMIKSFIEDNHVSRDALHFSSAWLELSVFDAFMDVQCSVASGKTVFHSDTGTISPSVTPPNSSGALASQPTFCLVYRFPFFAFSPQAPLLNCRPPSVASTFALNPSAATLEQGTYVVNFPRQNMQHKKDFLLSPGTVHAHSLKNLQDQSRSHLYIRVETGYVANDLRVYLSHGTEQLVLSHGIRVHQIFNVTEIYIDKEAFYDHNDCQLTIAREPQRIGNWKLTHGSSNLTYQLEGFGQECLQFSPEKAVWDSRGCLVTDSTNVQSVQCKCQGGPPIISVISGSLELQLVELPAYKVFGKQINLVVISFLVATMAAYTLALWWLCGGDKCAVRGGPRGGHVFALKTARSTAQHLYVITVQTGPFFNAGTSAAVSMILHGETGDSEVIKLADSHQVLQRCSTVSFLAGTKIALGNVASVEVWHDNSGEFPSWFLEDLTVVHWNTQRTWCFVFDEWLSTSSKDGRIEREAFASKNSPPVLRTMQRSLIHALCEHHLWHSTVTMKSCSSFSRGQRLLLCLSTVLFSGALSALHIFFTDVQPAATGLSAQYVGEAGLVCLIVHLVHQVPTAIFRHYDCMALLRNLWTRFRMLLFCIFDATCGRATRGQSTPSYSSSSYSLYTLYGIYRVRTEGTGGSAGGQSFHLSQFNEEDVSYTLSSTNSSAQLRKGQLHQEESTPARSREGSPHEQAAAGRQNLESREVEEEAVFSNTASPLEAALANLVKLQRQYRRNDDTIGDGYLECQERSPSPSLGDSELTCLDFDTDDNEDSDDSGVAYKVPSVADAAADRLTWLVGSLGWLLVAGLTLGSLGTLVCCTEMFLAGANALCFEITAVAVLWSIFVAYPIQACVVSTCTYMCWHLSQKPQSAFPMLPCACNEALQRLLRRIRIPAATPLFPLRHCKRLSKHPSHRAAGFMTQDSGHCYAGVDGLDTAWVQRWHPGHLLHHLMRYPSERKLVAIRRQCLAMVAAFKATRYCVSSALLITVLLANAVSENVEELYRQRQSIKRFINSTNGVGCDPHGRPERQLLTTLCDDDSHSLLLATGSVLLQSSRVCIHGEHVMFNRNHSLCPLLTKEAGHATFQRCRERSDDAAVRDPALKLQLYNHALKILSCLAVVQTCSFNRTNSHVSVSAHLLPHSDSALSAGFLEVCLLAVLCCRLRSLCWRGLKLKWPLLFQFWNIHEISLVVCGVCYYICYFIRASYRCYLSSHLHDADLSAVVEILSVTDSACQSLLGCLLFLAILGILRGVYVSRHPHGFPILLQLRTWRKQLVYLVLCWLFLVASSSWLLRPKQGRERGLLRGSVAAWGRLLRIPTVLLPDGCEFAGSSRLVSLIGMLAAVFGGFLVFALVARLFTRQRLRRDQTCPVLPFREFLSYLWLKTRILRGQAAGRSASAGNSDSSPPDTLKLLLELERVASEMAERADRLFAVPNEEKIERWKSLHLKATHAAPNTVSSKKSG